VTDLHLRARELDAADPLARFRDRFVIADEDLVYLDGNSLGRLPRATRERLRHLVDTEWGEGLIRSWDSWIDLGRRAGDEVARVVGARPGEVLVCDSTGVNLYKVASAALDARPDRRVIVVDDDNFPTDLYVMQGLAAARGMELRTIRTDIDNGISLADVEAALDDDVAMVTLSHVAYRSGAVADLPGITEAVRRAGALTVWDLSHAAGSVEIDLAGSGADLAVGCTYKHLNAGPGAPAYLYVRSDLLGEVRQPIWGWFGQRDQFGMGGTYQPVDTIEQFLVGSPTILGGYAVLEGAALTAEAGIAEVAAKTRALTAYLVELAEAWLYGYGFRLASPADPAARGAHVALHHPHAWQISQALRAAGVIPDYRVPDRLRIGVAPLYTRFEDLHLGLSRLREVMRTQAWRDHPAERAGRVT
jgi:kynureninase